MKNSNSGFKIMLNLITVVKPLFHIMLIAVFFGVLGFLCSTFLTILSAIAIIKVLNVETYSLFLNYSIKSILIFTFFIAIIRGFLHYIEQYCNHFIAFKLLALIRKKVFDALRKFSFAKLESKDKGNLISIITTDVELLEVFYAHTISPILIAFITCIIMIGFIASYSIYQAVFAMVAYFVIGVVIPIINGKMAKNYALEFRNDFGNLNSFILESLRGIDETIQYANTEKRKEEILKKSKTLNEKQKKLVKLEENQRIFTSFSILFFGVGMLFLNLYLYNNSIIRFDGLVITTFSMMASFGPVTALSSLSNTLSQTLASGQRVLSILKEKQENNKIDENENTNLQFCGVNVEDITFSYGNENILENLSLDIRKNEILGIYGKSGCGKSTFLKLLMRFFDVDKGKILISQKNIKEIPTNTLRNIESYVTQDTNLFQGSILENIKIGKLNATKQEVINACKKASIHEFIINLPNGYDTLVGELGDTLSGGEKQRISIARAFLHDSPLILLDEPTSNLDSLNEGIILKSLNDFSKEKTIVLLSHRKSTLNISTKIFEMKSKSVS